MPDCPILISNDLVCDEDTESNNTEDPPNNDCNAPQEVSGYQYVQTTVLPVDTMDQNMTTECYDAGYVTDFIQHTGSLDSTVHPDSYSDGDGEVGIDCQGIGPTELQVGLKFNTWFTENSPIIGSLRPFTCLSGLCHLSDSLLVESIQGVVPQHNESVCTGYCDEPTCMSPTDANPLPNGLYPFICLTE